MLIMKNNKGFTLIELLGVLAVLTIILLVAIPSITSTFERNKMKIKEQKENIVLSATEIYATKYKKEFDYDTFLLGGCGISISMLKSKNLITEDELLDSEGNLIYEDDVKIIYNKSEGVYELGNSSITVCG